MKALKILILTFGFGTQLFSNNDSIIKYKFFISTIPSNLVIGDISLGIEHLYKKRFSHEFQAYLKCYSIKKDWKYNRGFKLNYQLKYNFITRKYFRASINTTTSYLEYSFKNKEDYWNELSPDITITNKRATYLMDREIKMFGVGLGLGVNFRLNDHIYLGSDILMELSNQYKSYTVKRNINPTANGNYIILNEPYHYSSKGFSKFIFYHPILNLKLSYLL